MLEKLKSILWAAAAIMKNDFGVTAKNDRANVVTDNDLAVEKFLVEQLRNIFGDIGFICEEENLNDAKPHKYLAVIDPIDGTMNYVRDMRLSAISVAVLKDGSPYIAAVYLPFTDEMFAAQKGKGAFLNGRKIGVSDKTTGDALLFTAWSLYNKDLAEPCFDLCREVYPEISDIRRLGTASIELCYVACGRGDMYFEMRLFPWDYAAAALILTEAGGKIGTVHSNGVTYTRPQPIIAANNDQNFNFIKQKAEKYVTKDIYENGIYKR